MTSRTKSKKQKGWIIVVLVIILIAAVSIIAGRYLSDEKTEKPVAENTEQPTPPTQTVKTLLEGTWVSNYDGAMLSITGLSFSLDLASVDKSVTIKGTILVKDDLVTFINKNGICKDIQGQYRFSLKNNDLNFTVVKDECASRKERMTTGWFRL